MPVLLSILVHLCLMPNGLSTPDYLFWLGSWHPNNENWLQQCISLRYPVWSWMCVFFLCTQCIVFGFLAQGPLVCLNLLNSSTSKCVKPSLCAPSVNADTPEDASPEDNNCGEMTLLSLQHNPVICQQFASRRLPASSGSCMWGRCKTASGHLFQLYYWDGN